MQVILFLFLILLVDSFVPALAYFGPGVALPVLLLIIGIVLALLFLILVIFYYPIKKFLKKRKK